jgi:hypothetical protein
MHSPERIKQVQEARRLGGLRRRRESTISSAYQFDSLNSVEGIRRIVEVAVLDTLAMENSIARSRTLAYLAQVALHTLEVGDLETRIAALEESTRIKKWDHSEVIGVGLEARLKQLELKIRPTNTALEQHIDLDQCVARLGLVPATVRELARSKGSSLAEATSEMLGIDVREFKRQLQRAAYSVRWSCDNETEIWL